MVFTYETINCFSKKLNSIFVEELSDFETEKNASEADETDNENEKKDKIEDFYIDSDRFSIVLFTTTFSSNTNCAICTSAYSDIVYSPPEATIA